MTEETNQHWYEALSDGERQLIDWARNDELYDASDNVQDLVVTLADKLDERERDELARAFNPRGLLTSLLKQDYEQVFLIIKEHAPTMLAEVVRSRPPEQQEQFLNDYLRPLLSQLQALENELM